MTTRIVTMVDGLFGLFWEETSPGWICLVGLDRNADEKVMFVMEEPMARESREVARANGGVNILINDAQVVLALPNTEEG